MSLPHVLLGLLSQPATGYDLRHAFTSGAAHYWAAELSQIYPALKKLEDDGLVTAHEVASEKGPKRRLYERTKAGVDALCDWIESGPVVGQQRLAYVAQIEFAHETGDLDVTLRLVQELRTEFTPLRDLLVSVENELADKNADQAFHELLAVRLGVMTLNARLDWCDEAERRIERRQA